MKQILLYIISGMLSFLLSGCKKGAFGNEGEMVTTTRPSGSFGQIILSDNVNLVLTQDTIENIRVEAPSKIEPYITTQISNHSLTIRNENAGKLIPPGETINVYVSVKDLGRFDYLGSGNVSCTNTLNKDYFSFVVSDAAGDVHLKLKTIFTSVYLYSDMADLVLEGQSDSCYTYCSSLGTIDYSNYNVKKLGLDYSSIRDAYVWASQSLNGRIFYKGNVYYRGNPVLTRAETSNEGRFIHY